jgi:hypothetical protein
MKFLAIPLLAFCISQVHAEDLLVPISKFHNDSQQIDDSKVLEFWGSHIACLCPRAAGLGCAQRKLDTDLVAVLFL